MFPHPSTKSVGLIIEYNQKALADQLNDEVHLLESDEVAAGCIGENVLTSVAVHDFKGEALTFESQLTACIVHRANASDGTHYDVSGATISTRGSSDSTHVYALWNNTGSTAIFGASYELECSTNWTIGGIEYDFNFDKHLVFTRECDIGDNITVLDGNMTTLYGNATSIVISLSDKIDDVNVSLRGEIDGLATGGNLTQNITFLVNNISNITTAGDNSWITAIIEGLATSANLSQNITFVITNLTTVATHGDSVWISATGFAMPSDLEGLATSANLTQNVTYLVSNITDIAVVGESAWITAVVDGLATSANLSQNTTYVVNNLTGIVVAGDAAWITAIVDGLATSANLSQNVTFLVNNMTDVVNAPVTVNLEGVATQANLSQNITFLVNNMSDIIDAPVSVDDQAMAAAVFAFNSTTNKTFNSSQYEMYEALILSGYGSYAEEAQMCPDPNIFIGFNVVVPSEIMRYL